MDGLTFWEKKLTEPDLMNIETILKSTLKPVTPRPEFVQELRRGLMSHSIPGKNGSKHESENNIMLVVFSFLGAAFLLSLGIRAIASLVGLLGLWHFSRQPQPKKNLPTIAHP